MPRQPKTAKERADYRLGVSTRRYTRAVAAHNAAEQNLVKLRAAMTEAAAELAHRQADPALQDTGEES